MERHRSIQPASSNPPDHERPSILVKEESEMSKKRMKRGQTTAVACLSCRHYKCKCDGGFPMCGNCTAKGRSECKYDYEGGERRTIVLRETIRQLKDENTQLRSIIEEQNRQRTMDAFIAATAPPPSTLSISIPDFSPTASAPLSGWTPLSSSQPPSGIEFDSGSRQLSANDEMPAMDYDPLWPMSAVSEAHQGPSLPRIEHIGLSTNEQAPGSHLFPSQRR